MVESSDHCFGRSGAVWAADDAGLTPLSTDETQWDNHLVALT